VKKWLAIAVLGAVLAGTAAAAPSPAASQAQEALKAGRMDEAIALLRAATKEQSNDAEAWHLLSRAYLVLERWDDAVKAAERAVALEPNNSSYHLWLGRAYGEKADHSPFWTAWGMAKRVRMEFEKAVEINADNVEAMSDLAEFYIEAPGILGGGKDKAARTAELIAAHNETMAHWVRGRLAEENKDLDGAEKEYMAAVEASGNQAGAWLDLASFYRRTNQKAKMESTIKQALTAEKKSDETLYDAATLLYRAGRNFPLAIGLLRNYLKNPTSEEAPAFKAHYLLGEILEKQGDKAGAAQEYQAALDQAHDFQDAQQALKRVRQE
jgi:tetratricopeptide (TPR) repeat protein